MKKRRFSVKGIVLTVMWTVWIIGLGSVCWDAKEGLVSSVQIALEDAILKDFQERHDTELKYWGGRLGRKVKSVTIVTENGEENIEFKDSMDEMVAHRLAAQYLLAQIHPIHPDTLTHILQEELKKYDMESETGIVYTYKGQSKYSKNDSSVLHRSSVYLTPARVLDVKKVVSVRAWISTTPWYIVKNIYDGAFWSLLLLGAVLLWSSFSSWEEEDPNKIKFGKMMLNKESKKVTIDGKECKMRNQEFQLLLMLVEKKGHTLSRDEIKHAFWKEEIGVDNRVSNLISTLRSSLRDFPEYQIMLDENLVRLTTNSSDSPSKPSEMPTNS